MKSVAVIGTGNSGLAMAGHLALLGYPVRVWGRTASKIEAFREKNKIECEGAYAGSAEVELFTTDMAAAIDSVETILITTPATAHADIARHMAPYVKDSMTVVLNPGRTGGLLEFTCVLEKSGCLAHPTVAEAQTIIYTCRASETNHVNIVGLKNDVLLASYKRYDSKLTPSTPTLPEALADKFIKARNLTQTSIGNVGMVLHCAPTMMNSGWIECPQVQFKYYYQGISPSIATVLEKIDKERLEVATAFGSTVESLSDWLKRSYGIDGDTLVDCIRNNVAYAKIEAPESLQHRYILEDVPCGLVPLECFGRRLDVPTPVTTLTIDMACALMDIDFRDCGRNINNLGIGQMSRPQLQELFCS